LHGFVLVTTLLRYFMQCC